MTPTGFGPIDQIAIWCAVLAAIAGGAALLWRLLRGIRALINRVDQFLEDWIGVPDRPGVPGRRGVMERLEWVEHELKPNSGTSLRDAVNRVEKQLDPSEDGSLAHKVNHLVQTASTSET